MPLRARALNRNWSGVCCFRINTERNPPRGLNLPLSSPPPSAACLNASRSPGRTLRTSRPVDLMFARKPGAMIGTVEGPEWRGHRGKNMAFNVTHEVAALQRMTFKELRAKFADVGDDKTCRWMAPNLQMPNFVPGFVPFILQMVFQPRSGGRIKPRARARGLVPTCALQSRRDDRRVPRWIQSSLQSKRLQEGRLKEGHPSVI